MHCGRATKGFRSARFFFSKIPGFLNASWPRHGSKKFPDWPSKLVSRALSGITGIVHVENGSRYTGFTVSDGRFGPSCILKRGPAPGRGRGRCRPCSGIVQRTPIASTVPDEPFATHGLVSPHHFATSGMISCRPCTTFCNTPIMVCFILSGLECLVKLSLMLSSPLIFRTSIFPLAT